MSDSDILATRLENYTLKYPQELLMVHAHIEGETDTLIIFKGFSSSLIRPTAYDPDVPMLPENAVIDRIDRLESPYQPESPKYIEQGLSLSVFTARLAAIGL